jgi:hypothetical protein
MMYFSAGVKILRNHIIDDPEESQGGDQRDGDEGFFQSLRMCWTPPDRPLIEVSEGIVQPLVSLDAALACMLLFLDGQRDCLYLSNEPFLILQDNRGEPTPVAGVDPWYVFQLQARARQYGFYTKKIGRGLAVKPLLPRPIDWGLDENGRSKKWRGGKPTIRNFLNLRRNAFLPTLDEADGREEVTAVFVQKDFLEAFFGPWSYMIDRLEMPSQLPSFPGEDRMQIDEENWSPPPEHAMQVDEDLPRSQSHRDSSQQTPHNHGRERHQTQEPSRKGPPVDQINLPLDPALQVDGDLVLAETPENPVKRGRSGLNSRYQLPPRRRHSKPRSRSPSSRGPISRNQRERPKAGPSRSPIRPPSSTAPVSSLSVEELVRQSTTHAIQEPQALQALAQSPNTVVYEGSISQLQEAGPSQIQDTAGLSARTSPPRDEESIRNNRYKLPKRRDSSRKRHSKSPRFRSSTSRNRRERPQPGPSRSPIRPPGRTTPIPTPLSAEQLEEALLRRSPIPPPNSTYAPQPPPIPNPSPAVYGPLVPQEPVLDHTALQQRTDNLPREEDINRNSKSSSEVDALKNPEQGLSKRSPVRPPGSAILPGLPGSAPIDLPRLEDPAQIRRAKPPQVKPIGTSWPALSKSPQAEPEPLAKANEIPTQQIITLTHAGSALLPSPPGYEQPPLIPHNVSAFAADASRQPTLHLQEVLDETADMQHTTRRQAQSEDLSRNSQRRPHRQQGSGSRSGPRGTQGRRKPPADRPSRLLSQEPRTPRRSARIRLLSQEPQTPRRSARIRLLSQKPQTPQRSERIRGIAAATRNIQKAAPARTGARRQNLTTRPPKHKTTAAERSARDQHRSVLDTAPRAESSVRRNEVVQNALRILPRPEELSILDESTPLPVSAPSDFPRLEDPAQMEDTQRTIKNLAQGKEYRRLRRQQENRSRSRQRSRSRSPSSLRKRPADGTSRSPIAPPGLTTRARDPPRDAYSRSQSWSSSFESRDFRNRQDQSQAGQPQSIIPLPGPTTPVPSSSAYVPPSIEMNGDPTQRITENLQKEKKNSNRYDEASRLDPRGRSRRRSRRGSSSSRSPNSRKRRKGSPAHPGLLTLARDVIPPGPEALFTITRSPIHPPQNQMQKSSEDPHQPTSDHHSILQQARESPSPSITPDTLAHHKAQHAILQGFESPLAKSLRQKLSARANSKLSSRGEGPVDQEGKAARGAVRGLVDAADQFLISPNPRVPNPQSLGLRARSPVRPPGASSEYITPNIPVPIENTEERRSRPSSVRTSSIYAVPISSSDEGSSNERQPTPSQARTPTPCAPSDEGTQRRRSPIRPPGAYPSSSPSEGSVIEGRGQSHIRHLPPSGPKRKSARVHWTQSSAIYPSADDFLQDEEEEL